MGKVTVIIDGSEVACEERPESRELLKFTAKVLELAGARVGVNHEAATIIASTGHLPLWQARPSH